MTVAGYGSGALPILDGSDIIPNSSFTADGSGAYCTPSETFGYSGATAWINVWETGGPGDTATGQFLQNVSVRLSPIQRQAVITLRG